MTPIEELKAKLAEDIGPDKFRAGPIAAGGYAWWCFICQTGQTASTADREFDETIIGRAGLAHLLGPDHEAMQVLHT